MTRPKRKTTDQDVTANSIEYLATSIEAIGARVRLARGKADAWRVLNWAADEMDRLGAESRDIGDESRMDEVAGA